MTGQHSKPNSVSKLQIECMQTVSPSKSTDPTQHTRQVSIIDPIGSGIYRRCLNMILYYKNVTKEVDAGWIVAGWFRESLGKAMAEQPLIGGRLRRKSDQNEEFEIVCNDSGARLVEAKTSMTLSQFLDLKEREEDVEAELVFWKDIDEHYPQFSSLFYVQVTNFECGGYSIGISCSLLLADIIITQNFIKKWSKIHNDIVSNIHAPKTPMFFYPNFRNTNGPPTVFTTSDQTKNHGQTKIFKISDKNLNLEDETQKKQLMLFCIEEAEHELGNYKMGSKFPVIFKESSNVVKIESCMKVSIDDDELVGSQLNNGQVKSASWDDVLGVSEVVFHKGNKPSSVGYWIGSVLDGVVVMETPSSAGSCGPNIIVSIPSEKIT